MNIGHNSFISVLTITCILVLAIDFYVTITGKITIARKKYVHMTLWAIIVVPFSAIFATVLIQKGFNILGMLLWFFGIIMNLILNIIALKTKRKIDQEINIPELNFILEVAITLSRYINKNLDETEKQITTQYEKDCQIARIQRTLEYLKMIRTLANNYINARENQEKESIETYHNLILIEKARLNHHGIDYGTDGKIKNVEKVLELI